MFTGLIEALGTINGVSTDDHGQMLSVAVHFAGEVELGESISINGCCLSVVSVSAGVCSFQVGPETLKRTNLGKLSRGDRVNMERSLRLGDRLGGHIVSGHIDAVGTIAERLAQGDWETVWFAGPAEVVAQLVPKGSVAVDGVSLTVVEVQRGRFSVMLIPLTLAATTLGGKRVGAEVNLETDLIGKHVAQWMTSYRDVGR